MQLAVRAKTIALPAFCAFVCLSLEANESPKPKSALLPAPVRIGKLPSSVPESSGLVKSKKHPGVLWTHNDSGHKPRLIAVRTDGTVVASFLVPSEERHDWEAISMDDKGRLVVADIGNNSQKQKLFSLIRVAEPDPSKPDQHVKHADVFGFKYPKEARGVDAEAVVVRGRAAYVFSKEPKITRVFRVPLPETPPKEPVVAEKVSQTNRLSLCTGADLNVDGSALALLNYLSVATIRLANPWTASQRQPFKRVFVGEWKQRPALLGQCEGIAWDGDDLIITTEENRLFRKPGEVWAIHSKKK